ncbi:MAG TPA: hypothetical protein VK638_08510 [Edaphobacter sp.]|nr:hypothetical protein [Edaphobacter sp.]
MRTPNLACLLKHLGRKHTVVAIALSNSLLCGQTEPTKLDELLRLERENPTVLTYSQLSIYDKGEAVRYRGIVYLHIDSFTTQGCDLTAAITVQERYVAAEDRKKAFAGRVVHKQTSEVIDTYHYKYTLNLKEISPAGITTVIARPFQLKDDTSLSCSESKACTLHWLRVGSELPLVFETRIKNGFEDISTKTREMFIPMSTKDSASGFGEVLKTVTQTYRLNKSLDSSH